MTLVTRIGVMNGGIIRQIGTPDGIYRRPATRLVADVVGSPAMSFPAATLSGRRLAIGPAQIDFAGHTFAQTQTSGPATSVPVTFGIRPTA